MGKLVVVGKLVDDLVGKLVGKLVGILKMVIMMSTWPEAEEEGWLWASWWLWAAEPS